MIFMAFSGGKRGGAGPPRCSSLGDFGDGVGRLLGPVRHDGEGLQPDRPGGPERVNDNETGTGSI